MDKTALEQKLAMLEQGMERCVARLETAEAELRAANEACLRQEGAIVALRAIIAEETSAVEAAQNGNDNTNHRGAEPVKGRARR